MISTAILFYLSVSVCSPVNAECIDAVKQIYASKKECEQVIFDNQIFNAQCLPIDGISSQKVNK